jgi:two-component system, response regulator PdtaR
MLHLTGSNKYFDATEPLFTTCICPCVKKRVSKPLRGCRVLLIEDEAMTLFDIADLLTSAGATISGHATSAMSALYMAKAKDFDCAVMDVKLHDGDVLPAARMVSSLGRRIVFVTATPEMPELKAEWPDAEVLGKPATDKDVIRATAHACKGCAEHTILSG